MILTNQEEILQLLSEQKGKILLVESNPPKYISLGLLKLYTYLKHHSKHKDNITYLKYYIGSFKFDADDLDTIFISSGVFSYYHNHVIKVLKFYRREYPKAKIIVGGVYAIGNEEFRKEADTIGCTVIASLIDFLDNELPFIDYSLHEWNPWEFMFTTRGCIRRCKFCYVKELEPVKYVLKNWKNQILNSTRDSIILHDNNFNSFSEEHILDVLNTVKAMNKHIIFDSGFDCRIWNDFINHQMILLQKQKLLHYSSIRLAFDNTKSQDGHIQKAIQQITKYFPAKNIMVYVLVNFDSDLKDDYYRATELVKLGVIPFMQYYAPLTYRDLPYKFKGKHYTEELHVMHQFFNTKAYKESSYETYKEKSLKK